MKPTAAFKQTKRQQTERRMEELNDRLPARLRRTGSCLQLTFQAVDEEADEVRLESVLGSEFFWPLRCSRNRNGSVGQASRSFHHQYLIPHAQRSALV